MDTIKMQNMMKSDDFLDAVMADAAELARQVTARVDAIISAKFDEIFKSATD